VNIGPVMAFFGAKRSVLAGTWCVNNGVLYLAKHRIREKAKVKE
jgi:hypothetical protein